MIVPPGGTDRPECSRWTLVLLAVGGFGVFVVLAVVVHPLVHRPTVAFVVMAGALVAVLPALAHLRRLLSVSLPGSPRKWPPSHAALRGNGCVCLADHANSGGPAAGLAGLGCFEPGGLQGVVLRGERSK